MIPSFHLCDCVHVLDLKTGADVLFVMNYPAYVGEDSSDDLYHEHHPGLGYKYTSDQVCF
jgi:hypothetical protein